MRLPAQLQVAGNIGPRAIALVAIGQARVLATAAAALHEVDPRRAGRAADLAGRLKHAVSTQQRTASVAPDDGRPIAQAGEMVRHLAGVATSERQAELYRPALAEIVDRSPAVIRALADRAARAVIPGSGWVVPRDDPARRADDLLWGAITSPAEPRSRPFAAR